MKTRQRKLQRSGSSAGLLLGFKDFNLHARLCEHDGCGQAIGACSHHDGPARIGLHLFWALRSGHRQHADPAIRLHMGGCSGAKGKFRFLRPSFVSKHDIIK